MATTTILIDGNNLVHRSLYGAPKLTRDDGTEVGGAVGFVVTLAACLSVHRATTGAVAFDGPSRSFRRMLSEGYKGMREREPTPPETTWQIAAMRQACRRTGLAVIDSAPYEADDVIATLATRAVDRVIVCSDDKDSHFLTTNPRVRIHQFRDKPVSGVQPLMDAAQVRRRWGVDPHLVPHVQALAGDGGDGVPGLRGVGVVGAARMLASNGSVERVVLRLPEIGGKRWMEHASMACNARGMRDAVRPVTNANISAEPSALDDAWPRHLASVLAALGSERALASLCREHRLQPGRISPDDVLAPDNAAGADPLPRGLFG